MKKILLILALMATVVVAREHYQAYKFDDTHHVKTQLKERLTSQNIEINATLHVRYLEQNRTNYALFWLENGQRDNSSVKIDSIYSPFVVSYEPDGFIIKNIQTATKDREVQDKLIGIVELLQFSPSKEGIYHLPNALGELEVNGSKHKADYEMRYLAQYTKKRRREDIHYHESHGIILPDNNGSIWREITAQEHITFTQKAMGVTIHDRRAFHLQPSLNYLPKSHWFFDLSLNPKEWHFAQNHKTILSLSLAQKLFDSKMATLKALLNQGQSIELWVRENLDFLSHLSELLGGGKVLDNQVSKSLFAELGYIDNQQSVAILSEVALNEEIPNKERFRSLMGLKNSSAPISDESLDKILSMGLSDEGGEIGEMMGMLIGSLAYQRVDRVPQQYNKINDTLLNALSDRENKTTVLGAIGNMRQSASPEIIQGVEEVITSTNSARERRMGAEALLQIEQTNLPLEKVEKMINQESNSEVAEALIRTTAIAKDSATNRDEQYRFLTTIAKDQGRIKSNRVAALETLHQSGYGKTAEQKKEIRQMMLKERDSDAQKILREIYRR
jgi:hypothetical protein